MKRILLASLLVAAPALADPPTITLPTVLVSAIQTYLRGRTYSEVDQIISALNSCISVQVPDASGHLAPPATCPGVVKEPEKVDKKERK